MRRALKVVGGLLAFLVLGPALFAQSADLSVSLLDSPDPLKRVMQLMADRREAYRAAHVTIGVDNRTRYELVGELRRRWLSWLRAHRPPAPAPAP